MRYSGQIAAWGYALSEVEQIVVDAKATPGDEPESDEAEDFDPGE